jgi:ABC-type dipeptide/oligopeptide/nickel transport system permease component
MIEKAIAGTLVSLLAALPLAVTAALSLTIFAWRWPRWLRQGLMVASLAAACMPALSLVWSFTGIWLKHLRWPIESLMLMPTTGGGGWAAMVWNHAPAVMLAAMAPALVLLAFLLGEVRPVLNAGRCREMKPARWFDRHELPRLLGLLRPRLGWLALLTALGLVMAEDTLQLHGLGANLASAVRAGDLRAIASQAANVLVMAALVTVICRILIRRAPAPGVSNQSQSVVEGAVAAGLGWRQAWVRHALPLLLRRLAAILLKGAAWLWLAWVQFAALKAQEPGTALAAACERAVDDPLAPLRAGVAPALWALFLLLLGRIVAPRPRASSSWPTHLTPPTRRSSKSAT